MVIACLVLQESSGKFFCHSNVMDELSHLQAMRPWGYCDVSVSLSVNADVGLE